MSQLAQPSVLHTSVLLGQMMLPESYSPGNCVPKFRTWPLGQAALSVLPAYRRNTMLRAPLAEHSELKQKALVSGK